MLYEVITGYASLKSNNLQEAASHFQQAAEIMEQTGDEAGRAYMLGNLGNICFQTRHLEQLHDVLAVADEPAIDIGPHCSYPYDCDFISYNFV